MSSSNALENNLKKIKKIPWLISLLEEALMGRLKESKWSVGSPLIKKLKMYMNTKILKRRKPQKVQVH